MSSLFLYLLTLQSTLGPTAFFYEQGAIPEMAAEVLVLTVYAPTVWAVENCTPVETAVSAIMDSYITILDLP